MKNITEKAVKVKVEMEINITKEVEVEKGKGKEKEKEVNIEGVIKIKEKKGVIQEDNKMKKFQKKVTIIL